MLAHKLTSGAVGGAVWIALSACGSELAPPYATDQSDEADVEVSSDDAAEVETVVCGETELAPPPVPIAQGRVVPIDVTRLEVEVRFDGIEQRALATARMSFVMGPTGGLPVFDLRQTPISIALDGESLPLEALERVELASTDTGGVLVLNVELAACSRHELVIDYELARGELLGASCDQRSPLGTEQQLPCWDEHGVVWTSSFSDTRPGKLMESWFPVGLIHDVFDIGLDIRIENVGEHTFVANSGQQIRGVNRWYVHWTDADSATPLWYLKPAAQVVKWPDAAGLVDLYVAVDADTPDPERWLAMTHAVLVELTARWGERAGGDMPYLLIVDDMMPFASGMEYVNAAVVHDVYPELLRHEIAHAWLGRTLRPARHIDAWWDEAAATVVEVEGVYAIPPVDPFDAAAVSILTADPWTRQTALGAYRQGASVFAAIVGLLGRERVDEVLRTWIARCPHGHITHHDLREAFAEAGARAEIEALFDRWIIPPGDRVVRGDCR